jgi:hypothetical protein
VTNAIASEIDQHSECVGLGRFGGNGPTSRRPQQRELYKVFGVPSITSDDDSRPKEDRTIRSSKVVEPRESGGVGQRSSKWPHRY